MLEIKKMPSYLSPSSLMKSMKQPNTFYLERLIDCNFPRERQSTAAGVGTQFDYLIKKRIIEDPKFKYIDGYDGSFESSKKKIDKLKEQVTCEDELLARKGGQLALDFYRDTEYMDNNFHRIELNLQKEIEGVPILGLPDATVLYKDEDDFEWEVPFDWKVSGFTSKTGASPKKGYKRLWDGGRLKGSHKAYHKEITFDEIDSSWATQLTTYGFLLGIPIGFSYKAYIDMLCYRNGSFRIAKYEAWITSQMQRRILNNYKQIWKELKDGSYINRLVDKYDINFVWTATGDERWF